MFACGAGDKFVPENRHVTGERATGGDVTSEVCPDDVARPADVARPDDVVCQDNAARPASTNCPTVADTRSATVTRSTADTIALGERLGRLLEAGDVLVLTGDLGAGKTQLTKGIARGMGIEDDVCSPTFTIGMVYEGDELPLYHFDLYRLEDVAQLDDTGIVDVLGDDGPCVIEWGEQFADELGDERLDVVLRRLDDEAAAGEEPSRVVSFVAHGERAAEIIAGLDL